MWVSPQLLKRRGTREIIRREEEAVVKGDDGEGRERGSRMAGPISSLLAGW